MDNKPNKNIRKYAVIVLGILFINVLMIVGNSKPSKPTASSKAIEVKKAIETEDKVVTGGAIGVGESLVPTEVPNEIGENVRFEIDKVITSFYDTSDEVNADAEVSEKREGIESYQNIKTFVRPGMEMNSYVVFTLYDMKFMHIETLAPGMSVLEVTSIDGMFEVVQNADNTVFNEYVSQLSQDIEIKNLIEEVNIKLSSALEQDETLRAFIEKLKTASNAP